MARILVAGIGNIFLGDDGFGPEVVRRVAGEPEGNDSDVHVVDYGIHGMQLAYDLLDGWDALILVDAVPDRGRPGEVRVFEADPLATATPEGLDAHRMDPAAVFASLRALGGTPPRTILVGCQVACIDHGIGLSAPVEAAGPEAVHAVTELIAALNGQRRA